MWRGNNLSMLFVGRIVLGTSGNNNIRELKIHEGERKRARVCLFGLSPHAELSVMCKAGWKLVGCSSTTKFWPKIVHTKMRFTKAFTSDWWKVSKTSSSSSFSFSYSIIAVVTRFPFPSFFLIFNLEPKMIFVAFFFSDSKLQKYYMYKLLF